MYKEKPLNSNFWRPFVLKVGSLLAFILLLAFVGWIGRTLTSTSVGDWYQTLEKPKGNPPDSIFAPVWTLLYLMIGVSGWLVFVKAKSSTRKKIGFVIYGLQLVSNVLWSYFFFFLKNPKLAFFNIVILLFLIGCNTTLFWRLYRPAGALLVPYLLWVLYALRLNAAIWSLNPTPNTETAATGLLYSAKRLPTNFSLKTKIEISPWTLS